VPYIFLERYCKVTANLPGTGPSEQFIRAGIVTITGWIIMADENSILLVDEYNNNNLIKREQLIGSIVVLFDQPEPNWQTKEEKGVMEVGM